MGLLKTLQPGEIFDSSFALLEPDIVKKQERSRTLMKFIGKDHYKVVECSRNVHKIYLE